MIITCDKCSTKFNLDETLIKQTGSKVRCSVCSKVFTAFPPESSIQDEKDKEEEKTEPLEEPPAPSEEDPETTPADESFFGLEGIDDIGNELGIEDEEDESKNGTDQEPGKESSEGPFPAYELELDQELEEEIRFLEKEDEAPGAEPAAPAEEPGTPSETESEPLEDELELPESTEQEQPGPDISTEDAFSLEEEEEGEPLDLEGEESDSLDLDLEGMDLEDESGSFDLDLNDIDTDEPDKDPGFDLDLDDETLELSMDDLEEMPEEEFDALESEETEFDFTADDDDSFELQIDSDLEDEDDRGSFRPEKTDFEKSNLETVTGREPAEPSTQPPPELEIGDLDITEPDEMDIELDDASGLRQEDESEPEDLDDQYADIEFEEDEEPAGGSDEEEVEEFDLTLYDESLEDDFEDEEAEDDYQPETEDEAEGDFEIGEQEASADPKIDKPRMHDLMEPDKPSKPSGASKFLKFILSILVIAIILVTGYSACIIMGIQVPYLSSLEIPFIESTLKKYQKKPAPADISLDNQSINGRFASNKEEGKLFIITGKAANNSDFPVSHIKVEGTLITKGDVTARTKQAYCGNRVPEETLKTGDMEQIDRLLTQKSGTHGSNENIRPNGSIPFMIVFANLPENLENFSVKLAGHSRPDQGN